VKIVYTAAFFENILSKSSLHIMAVITAINTKKYSKVKTKLAEVGIEDATIEPIQENAKVEITTTARAKVEITTTARAKVEISEPAHKKSDIAEISQKQDYTNRLQNISALELCSDIYPLFHKGEHTPELKGALLEILPNQCTLYSLLKEQDKKPGHDRDISSQAYEVTCKTLESAINFAEHVLQNIPFTRKLQKIYDARFNRRDPYFFNMAYPEPAFSLQCEIRAMC
jgi:hypothetical protein